MITSTSAIAILNSTISDLQHVYNHDEFHTWQVNSIALLEKLHTQKSVIENFSKIKSLINYGVATSERLPQAKKSSMQILNGVITSINTFGIEGLPEVADKKPSTVINNYNSLHSEQSSIIDIDLKVKQQLDLKLKFIVEVFKDELSGKQLKELQEIQLSSDTPDVKKKKFHEKLKSFGTDILAGIVSGIASNPDFIQQLTS